MTRWGETKTLGEAVAGMAGFRGTSVGPQSMAALVGEIKGKISRNQRQQKMLKDMRGRNEIDAQEFSRGMQRLIKKLENIYKEIPR